MSDDLFLVGMILVAVVLGAIMALCAFRISVQASTEARRDKVGLFSEPEEVSDVTELTGDEDVSE